MAYPDVTVENVLPKLLAWSESGQKVCLATLYYSYGTSPRPVGSQMAIAEDGHWFGYLSGGCAEQAIADQGALAIRQQTNRSVRYGVGSPYLDIQLPCGAGIDVWFDQAVDPDLIATILARLGNRERSGLRCEMANASSSASLAAEPKDELSSNAFQRWYTPARRLYIIGAGPAVTALSTLAGEADYSVEVLTPDQQTYSEAKQNTQRVSLLSDQSQVDALATDAWTSVVLMFHEHERETKILHRFINSDVIYLGAMGSTRTQNARFDLLKKLGATPAQCAQIHGPVGLEIQARTPMEIAVSVLAELTLEYQRAAFALLERG